MSVKVIVGIIALLLIVGSNAHTVKSLKRSKPNVTIDYSAQVHKIYDAVTKDPQFRHASWNRLAYIVDTFGPRLWGGAALELAIQELLREIKDEGFENPHLEPVNNITAWVREEESLTLYNPRPFPQKMPMIGLGKSVAGNVTAEVIVVKSFDELEQKKDQVKGKIVLYNEPWVTYGSSVAYRASGASIAAKYGAIGCLVRSVAPFSMASPHTGGVNYNPQYPQIPAAAITIEDAEMLQRMQDRRQKIVVNLNMKNHLEPGHTTQNVLGEITGSTYPDQVILIGGHYDSWDTGTQTGANDDGGGVMTTLEAVRVLIKLGLRPKRTIRFIAWSGEEYGGSMSGAAQQVRQHEKEVEKYIAVFESDLGSTTPYGFGYSGGPKGFKQVWELAQNLNFMNAGLIVYGDGDSVDSGYFAPYGVPIMRNEIKDTTDNSFYFSYHHSAADSMTMMNPEDMDLNVIAIASMMYMIADADVTLPRD